MLKTPFGNIEEIVKDGVVPRDCRKANVLIFKREKKEDPGNYKSESLTLMSNSETGSLCEHLDKNIGFMKKKAC